MSLELDILTYTVEIDFISETEITVNIVDGISVYQDGVRKVTGVQALNFIAGTNTTVDVDKYEGKARVKVNSTASGGGGSGTVTSVSSGNLSPLLTVSVANPTTTPALTFVQVVQAANLIFAGPSSGSNANPTFRALVAADHPLAQLLVNSATALVDAATIDLTATKHTLSTSIGRTFTISYTGDDITLIITLSATSATFTFPATTLCVANGTANGDNTMAFTGGASGDKLVIAIKKIGSDYYAVGKNFGQ